MIRRPLRHALLPAVAASIVVAPTATAQTVVPEYVSVSPDATPAIASATELDGRVVLQVASPAMRREVAVTVLRPADRSRAHGSYYLLDGNSGQVTENNWLDPGRGNAREFFSDKNVNVVLPIGGTGTNYTDWDQDHPVFGRTKWETFLAEELPPLIDARFGTNGRAVIGGISSGAAGAVMIAQRHPDVFAGAVGYSGCYLTDGPVGKALTDLVVINGRATSEMMWGPPAGEQWRTHDPIAHAGALAAKPVYLSSGSGLPGPHEDPASPDFARTAIVGGALELGSKLCTDRLEQALRSAGAVVTRSATPVGTHAWPYWRDELARSWPTIRAAAEG
ncbi:esterase family protein [Rhodococcus spelaei]|uniref:Esterase family protein n=1 Tax=Rhodococcus spelaei TaxID=2546320 RepID=A0A541BNL2_9NOCA|nr:alpha/beta hydrolase family protein [Rhodococcus spelaei]TQF73913.1 esterase family protein [Rhodococcus spelaei]